jgi:hypothetical protein
MNKSTGANKDAYAPIENISDLKLRFFGQNLVF